MLPVGVETVTVSSGVPLALPDGTWITGRVLFKGPDLAVIGEDDLTFGGTAVADLVDGQFSKALIPQDATGISPTGWTYEVTSDFDNAPNWVRYILLTAANPTVKLADVLVPDPVAGTYSVLVDPADIDLSSLGLGNSATRDVGAVAGTVPDGADSRFTDARNPTGAAGGDLSGTYPNPTVAKIGGVAAATVLAGKADLVGGVIPTAQLPALAISETFTVASQAAMLALVAQRGDVAVRSDTTPTRVYILAADTPTVLSAWVQISFGAIATVNGQAGIVVLGAADVGADAAGAAGNAQAAAIADAIGKYLPLAGGGTVTGSLAVTGAVTAGGNVLSRTPDVQVFTASGTWTKPAGAVAVQLHMLGGGGSGGSGRRGAAGSVRCGGGGGAGSSVFQATLQASALTATVAVTVGTGGTGSAARTTDDTDGGTGAAGTPSSFGPYARIGTTTGGAGGTATAGAGGTAGSGTTTGATGGAASTTGGAGSSGLPGVMAAPSGGAGGGITSGNVAGAGGAGGGNGANVAGSGGTVDTTPPTAAADTAAGSGLVGGGAGGGAASITAAAQAGAAGARYGAGGGGGGASLNGNNSGAGGTGGPGIVIVITYF